MKDPEKDKDFQKWVFNLDKRFLDWSWRSPGGIDDYTIRNNARGCDKTFKRLLYRCNAPGCRYPLGNDVDVARLPLLGDVCNLCYYMYHLLNAKAYWVAIQQQENEKKKGR